LRRWRKYSAYRKYAKAMSGPSGEEKATLNNRWLLSSHYLAILQRLEASYNSHSDPVLMLKHAESCLSSCFPHH
jgi:hypothetical protein